MQPDHAVASDDGDDQRLGDQQQARNLLRNGVIKLLMTETLHPWFLRDLLQLHHHEGERYRQYGKTQLPLEQEVTRNSHERTGDVLILNEKSEGEVFRRAFT